MLLKWRIQLKQAEEALKAGRLEEAYRLANGSRVREFRGARRLVAKVAEALARRANQRLQSGQSSAAWNDLEQADRLGANAKKLAAVRDELAKRLIDEAEHYLQAGQPDAAEAALAKLQRRGIISAQGRRLKQVAATWQAGREQLQRGEFAQANESLQEAGRLLTKCAPLTECCGQAAAGIKQSPALLQAITEALGQEKWADVIQAAQPLLALAPKHPIALRVTRQAWEKLGALPAGNGAARTEAQIMQPTIPIAAGESSTPAGPRQSAQAKVMATTADRNGRFLMWVDAVGGYLVCPSDEVVVGQPGGTADVPILGDVSARHATLLRDEEGWVIQPHRAVTINGKTLAGRVPLRDGDELLLGSSVRLRFRRPTPVSTTARLEFAGRHRLLWAVDAVLLMGDTCILGPRLQSHVVCPQWDGQVVIYRQDDELWCRSEQPMEIDGRAVAHRGQLHESAKVSGEQFSFSLEPVVSSEKSL